MAYSLFHTLNTSRNDMLSRLLDLDVISNNLANMNTAGFKASRANFQELLTAQTRDGVSLRNTQMLDTQGSVRQSENSLDWAIQGEGFFPVELPDGTTAYTRDGQFVIDGDGRLVNASGYPLVWDGELPEDFADLSISPDGTVQVTRADGTAETAGQIELARFTNASGLLANGNNTWLQSEDSGEAQLGAPGDENFGWVYPHAVEQSNLNIAEEMSHMMTLQRAFQMSVRTFQQTDTMISQAIHMRKA